MIPLPKHLLPDVKIDGQEVEPEAFMRACEMEIAAYGTAYMKIYREDGKTVQDLMSVGKIMKTAEEREAKNGPSSKAKDNV